MRVGGYVVVTIAGQQITLGGEIEDLVPGGPVREVARDATGRGVGYLETVEPGSFKLTFMHRPDGPTITDVQAWDGVEAAIRLANGRSYSTDSLTTLRVSAIDPAKGTFSAEFSALTPLREVA